jgi:hypothetical protein
VNALRLWPGAGGLARLGERIDSVDQDCRRSVHSPPGCLVLITDEMPGEGDVASACEQLRQALLQQLNVRAVGHREHSQMHNRRLLYPLCRGKQG